MSNKKYYKTVSQQNDNLLVMEFDYDNGGGVLFNLVDLTSRELQSGEEFEAVFEISEDGYQDLVRTYFIKLGDRLASIAEGEMTPEEAFDYITALSEAEGKTMEDLLEPEVEDWEISSEESFNKAMEVIVEDMLEKEWKKEDEEFDKTLGLEPEEEKPFEPKTAFSLMHKDIQVGGFSERTTIELIQFISDAKKNYQHMLIKNVDGEIVAMVDAQTVLESSFEFEEF